MNTTSPEQVRALRLLRQIWGTRGHSMTHAERAEISAMRPEDSNSMVAVEICLRVAGLWDQYLAAGHPTWTSFRQWLDRVCPEEVA